MPNHDIDHKNQILQSAIADLPSIISPENDDMDCAKENLEMK